MINRFVLLILAIFGSHFIVAQEAVMLSDGAEIQLITVDAGAELYSTFGHSALRVVDASTGINKVYNYGTFDFDTPDFYQKFMQGKLLYYLNIESSRAFEYGNIADRRAMQIQTLQLDKAQRQKLFQLLETNAKDENKNYKYDFFYDNCSTRIRDIVKATFDYQLFYDSTGLQNGTTMRQLLRPGVAKMPWISFGFDLILGSNTDRKALAEDYMFLPPHMHDIFSKTQTPDGKPLIQEERFLSVPALPVPAQTGIMDKPFWVMCLIGVIGLLSYVNRRVSRVFDTLFWLTIGIIGLIITLLWFATEHQSTKLNYNILWALPTHLLFFWRRYRPTWLNNYYVATGVVAVLVLLFWRWIPQEMPVAAIPLVVLVAVKSLYHPYRETSKVA